MDVLRSRFAALIAAGAFALALTACGDDDGEGAAEDVEQGVKKGAKKIEKEGKELGRDAEAEGKRLKRKVEGRDGKYQRD